MAALSKAGVFKGSIAVLVLYIGIALGLLCVMVFQPGGMGAVLAEDMVVFTVVLIVGMVIVGFMMFRYVLTYDPQMVFVPVKPISCPDYYNLTMDPNAKSVDKRAVCTNTSVYKAPKTSTTNNASLIAALGADKSCGTMYPIALTNGEKDPFDKRKLFSTECSVPWTDNLGNFTLLDYNNGAA